MNFHEYPMKNIHSFDVEFPVMFQVNVPMKSWRFIAMIHPIFYGEIPWESLIFDGEFPIIFPLTLHKSP